MQLSLKTIQDCLVKEQLLKEFVTKDAWTFRLPNAFNKQFVDHLSYNSQDITKNTLFFCKGLNFKKDYLVDAVQNGLSIYISEQPYDVPADLGIIVSDVKKAMAILSMAFYNYPQNKLKVIGFTGTKGKTTAAYFAKSILTNATKGKTAMLSTMCSTLDGKTFFKSKLTTPESLDLYRMMNEAVQNNMTHFVMEVSSQAYKIDRVYQLFYDVGIFLNITPDHISPIEHPTFDDYFYCKRQIIAHSKQIILNRETDYFQLLKETADYFNVPTIVYGNQPTTEVDYWYQKKSQDSLAFTIVAEKDFLFISGDYQLHLAGDFNKSNALSAVIASSLLGANKKDCQTGINETIVPGRMELLKNKNNAQVYIDYAHNYDSLYHLLSFVKQDHKNGRVIVVIGSTGNKGISRRKDFGAVLSKFADIAILTTDDPADEDPKAICQEIANSITTNVTSFITVDRKKAIQQALEMSQPADAVVLAGKGADLYQKIKGEDIPYEGDSNIAKELINQEMTSW